MSLLVVFGLLVELFFKSCYTSQILLLLQKHSVSLEISILDSFLALIGKLLDSFFFFFIESDSLFLVLEKRHKMIVLFGSSLKLRRQSSDRVLDLSSFSFMVDDLRFRVSLFDT